MMPHRALAMMLFITVARTATADVESRVVPILPPATPLPSEARSRDITAFSFILYGDTRGPNDGTALQYDHSRVVDEMLAEIKRLSATSYPVRFVLQSGDAVLDGRIAGQWNVSFVPLINRLTQEGGVSYFLVPGNHEHTTEPEGLKNYLDAVSALIPPQGSPRRLRGYTTFSVGYGNLFVIGLDTNLPENETQYRWIKAQLESLDRQRFVHVIVLCHQAPFSSGPHGGAKVEPQSQELRDRYLPLFHVHHVRAVFSGHEHLFEHWVEHYTDAPGTHRIDLVVSGGGGAPLYPYTAEPDIKPYENANRALKVTLEHLVKPGPQDALSPHHFVVVRMNGDRLSLHVIGVDAGTTFAPYGTADVELQDR
jgi:3',5'-cyclic AMP phosphodiesterase CpdA